MELPCPDDHGDKLAEVFIDSEGGLLNNAKLSTRQDPATGKCFFPDVIIVHTGIQHRCDWVHLNALSSDHKPILTTAEISHLIFMALTTLIEKTKIEQVW